MKRKKIVVGNWKMNMTMDQSNSLIKELKSISENDVEIKIAPSFTNLHNAVLFGQFSSSNSQYIEVVAQNIHSEERGAYTGEISAEMLKSIGVKSVIIGHSERRKYFNETDSILSKKVKTAIKYNIGVIFCVGEELSERENNNHFNIIKDQISIGLFDLDVYEINKVVIAYEPVWAIGTGKTANSNQIQEMHEFIRELVRDKFDHLRNKSTNDSAASESLRILYGGSVKPNNAKEIFSLQDVDGGLIGGASLNFADFSTIIKAANG
jgi:triosephosphate isomerase